MENKELTKEEKFGVLKQFYLDKVETAPEFLMSFQMRMHQATDILQLQSIWEEFKQWALSEGWEIVNERTGQEEE